MEKSFSTFFFFPLLLLIIYFIVTVKKPSNFLFRLKINFICQYYNKKKKTKRKKKKKKDDIDKEFDSQRINVIKNQNQHQVETIQIANKLISVIQQRF